mgnify:CR=1 FL=1
MLAGAGRAALLECPAMEATEPFTRLEGIPAAELAALAGRGPLVRIRTDARNRPRGATCLLGAAAPVERIWSGLRDLGALPQLIEMVESLHRLPAEHGQPERVLVRLRFKIAIFSTRFDFTASIERAEGRWLELRYLAGKVRDLLIRLELAAVDAGHSLLLCRVDFDPQSLGWLANIFIRHHPEIEWGIHAGSAVSVAQAARQLAERPAT